MYVFTLRNLAPMQSNAHKSQKLFKRLSEPVARYIALVSRELSLFSMIKTAQRRQVQAGFAPLPQEAAKTERQMHAKLAQFTIHPVTNTHVGTCKVPGLRAMPSREKSLNR
jgi:hypothetical protein